MSMHRHLRSVIIATAAAGALVLSACGSSDSGGAASSASSAATSAASAVASAVAPATTSTPGATGDTATGSAGGESGGPSQADIDAATAALIKPGALVVCTSLSYEPFQFVREGEIVGFDVALLDLVTAELGVTQEIIDTPFEGIQSGEATATGQCDAAAAAMSIKPEREEVMLFSEPYFDVFQALVVPEASSATSLADLSGVRVAGQTGTTGLDFLKAEQAANGYEIVEYADFPSQREALITAQVDAAVNDSSVWGRAIADNPGVIKQVATFEGEQYGVGMALDAEPLKAVVDATLAQAKADGTYDAIYEEWIGGEPPAN
jgi:polar amino acid transport system substrate-binding protein